MEDERAHPIPTSAHTLLVAIYQDVRLPIEVRVEAAKAAIGYEKPRLASIKHSGDADAPLTIVTHIELVAPDNHKSNG